MAGFWSRSKAAVQSSFQMDGRLPSPLSTFASEYRLDSSQIDVKLARALYSNTEPRYKLGAGFCRPAINIPVGFMGVPILRVENGSSNFAAQDILDRHIPRWEGMIRDIHKAVLLDGEALVRLRPANRSPAYAALFSPSSQDVELSYEPAEAYEALYMDEDMGALWGFQVKHLFTVEEAGRTVEKHLFETVTADRIVLEYEDNWKPKREFPNPLGFVPAVVIRNENHRHQLRGRSELEPLEPYLKFYHDVMLHAGAASKLHSTAKLVLRVQDVDRFLINNFSDAEIAEGRLRFKDKDVLFLETGSPEIGVTGAQAYAEGVEIVQARAPLGDTNTLLEYIFLNIVDVSEIPEWAFGGAIASSKASVSEQSPPLIHKVNRKRSAFTNLWALVGQMALKMHSVEVAVEAIWEDVSQRDTKSEAEGLKYLAEALVALNDAEIMSKTSVADELRPYIRHLLPYDVDNSRKEKERIESEREQQEQILPPGGGLEQLLQEQDQANADREAGLRAIG